MVENETGLKIKKFRTDNRVSMKTPDSRSFAMNTESEWREPCQVHLNTMV